jgi:hypothetical protein
MGVRMGLLPPDRKSRGFAANGWAVVLDDRCGVNYSVLSVPKGYEGRLSYVDAFLQAAKASGVMQHAIERSGWRGDKIVID